MYFATDLDNRQIKSEDGEIFTAGQLKTIVDHTAAKNEFLDMTLMTQRFISLDYDWDKLEDHYRDT